MKALPYDKTDKKSIFNYSIGLLGHCLRDFAEDSDYSQLSAKDKGKLGKLVEYLYFKSPQNHNPEADFVEANIELKCTGLKLSVKQEYLIKERLVCGMINYCDVVKESFEKSHFYQKCILMLILFYLYQKGSDRLDLKFIYSVLWKLPKKDLLIIKNDYQTIIDKIKKGQAHLLSEGDTVYLGACRKGDKRNELCTQPYSSVKAKGRAFCLKPAYMRTVLNYVQDCKTNSVCNVNNIQASDSLVTVASLKKMPFEEILLHRFDHYYGKDCFQILKQKGFPFSFSKGQYFMSANAIVGNGKIGNVNKSEEFEKSGIMLKTVRLEKNGIIRQSMSFENIDWNEVFECDEWEDSRLYEIFSNRFLFVVYKNSGSPVKNREYRRWRNKENEERKKNGKSLLKIEDSYVLDRVFFWTMPQEDLAVAKEFWGNIKQRVIQDKIRNGEFWKLDDDKMFHVRPKAKLSKFKDISPVTGKETADKLCYWFNSNYVRKIVNEKYDIKNEN